MPKANKGVALTGEDLENLWGKNPEKDDLKTIQYYVERRDKCFAACEKIPTSKLCPGLLKDMTKTINNLLILLDNKKQDDKIVIKARFLVGLTGTREANNEQKTNS